ncbi:MAG: hypothetical protein JWP12_3161 [Bacteroidetes bacterium]|nr:hypothetical protein [Bacteroidota bacterium]
MKFKKYITALLLLLFVVAGNTQSFAQCAMCRTTAESDLNNGGSIANGLNTGILYLMAIPYVILMTGGYFFFKKQVDAKLKEWRNKFFPSKTKTVN